jgi:rhomboid family GlyGly-CTERM serine protease
VSTFAAVGAVALLSALFTFVPWLHAHGLYLRDAVMGHGWSGQWWRLLTAMWVHLNAGHWLADVLAAAGLLLLIARETRSGAMLVALLVLGVAVQLTLLFVPSVHWYGGLSGALHGLALWGGLRLMHGEAGSRQIGVVLTIGGLVKVWLEQSWLAAVVFDPDWGFGVVRGAHAAGAIAGFALWLLQDWWRRRSAAPPA